MSSRSMRLAALAAFGAASAAVVVLAQSGTVPNAADRERSSRAGGGADGSMIAASVPAVAAAVCMESPRESDTITAPSCATSAGVPSGMAPDAADAAVGGVTGVFFDGSLPVMAGTMCVPLAEMPMHTMAAMSGGWVVMVPGSPAFYTMPMGAQMAIPAGSVPMMAVMPVTVMVQRSAQADGAGMSMVVPTMMLQPMGAMLMGAPAAMQGTAPMGEPMTMAAPMSGATPAGSAPSMNARPMAPAPMAYWMLVQPPAMFAVPVGMSAGVMPPQAMNSAAPVSSAAAGGPSMVTGGRSESKIACPGQDGGVSSQEAALPSMENRTPLAGGMDRP